MNQFIEGFFLQASLILALGAQNLFVLESGLRKQRHFLVALICSICDSVLIAIGIAGAASLFIQFPFIKIILGILGILFLFYYGLRKILDGFGESKIIHEKIEYSLNLKKVIFLALSFSLLNPHVYLDTIVLIGGYSAKYSDIKMRGLFGFGAASFSMLWFFGLSLFAHFLSGLINNRKAMKTISIVSGFILLAFAWKLGIDVYSWR